MANISEEIEELRDMLADLLKDGSVTDDAHDEIESCVAAIEREADDLSTYREVCREVAGLFDCEETASAETLQDEITKRATARGEAESRIAATLTRRGVIGCNRAASLDLTDIADMVETGVLFVDRGLR